MPTANESPVWPFRLVRSAPCSIERSSTLVRRHNHDLLANVSDITGQPRTGSDMTRGSTPAGGYGKFVGRVGALALFLGVGTVFAVPAIASADESPGGSTAVSSS